MVLRRSEWVIIIYFVYTSILACLLPVRPSVAGTAVCVNALVIGGCFLLRWAESLRGSEFFSIVRDWYPAPLMLLAYRQMGWFAPASHTYDFEQIWVTWDRFLLYRMGLKGLIESTGTVLPSLLEVSYSLVYTTAAFSVAMLYIYKERRRVDRFLFQFLVGIYLAYGLFPYFPSEPPRTVFPGADFPAVETVFRRFNWWILGGYGIHTSVFPSAHVSGAFSAAFGMLRILPEHKWTGRFLLVLAVLIATATVYGRYHYAADAFAGLAAALIALFVARLVEQRSGLGL